MRGWRRIRPDTRGALANELQQLRDRDPLPLYERRLRGEAILDDALWTQLRAEVDADIAAAERYASRRPWPDAEQAALDA